MNSAKRYLAVMLAGMMLLPAFACSKNEDDESSGSNTSESGEAADSSGNSGESGESGSGNDQNSSAESQDSAEMMSEIMGGDNAIVTATDEDGKISINYVVNFNDNIPDSEEDAANAIVTTIRGDDGKIYVPRTDINGTTITQADGSPQTDVYTGTTLPTTYESPTYVPAFRNYMAMWLDISNKEDFVFDGDLLEYELEIAQDAPSGVYPIEFTLLELGDYDGKGFAQIDQNPGYVCINHDAPAQTLVDNGNPTLTIDTVSVNPGDTTRLKMKITNNTGIVAFRIMIRYDSNVIKIKDAGSGRDLASYATLTARQIGEN
ncbi:MAG: hypothetical protein IJ060_00230 [Oscillospiraceae bacterium]|nr:hypothetical protein [Oscillospiraceae bacterium]